MRAENLIHAVNLEFFYGGKVTRMARGALLLYIGFVRMLQLMRLCRRGQEERDDPASPADATSLASGLSRVLSVARRRRFLVQPETLLRWHRDLVRRKWSYSRRAGRPKHFFAIDTLSLRRLDVLFWIEIDTQRMHLCGVAANLATC